LSARKRGTSAASFGVVRELLREALIAGRSLSILKPVCERSGVEMKLIERRLVLRLLAETEAMLVEVGQQLKI
jgi:hypothetical protein